MREPPIWVMRLLFYIAGFAVAVLLAWAAKELLS